MRHNGDRRPDEILAEIDRTRGEMDRTLTAIEQRLTPGQLMDQSLDYLRQSGANEFVHNLGGAAKNNPLPVALVGIGLAWLMALGRQPAQHEGAMAYGSGGGSRMREGLSSMKDKASGMMHGASERMGSMREGASGSMGSMKERAGQMSDSARQQWQRARGGVDSLINEQPLALGAIGLAIGAVVGGIAPRTRKEEEMMGEASRSMMEKTKEAAAPHLEKAKETAKQAAQTATSALQAEQTRKEPQSSGKPSAPPATPTTPRPPRQGL
jgi:ElaB/YqjD/DUF883 family membrane-anchored ribosome-binding protein